MRRADGDKAGMIGPRHMRRGKPPVRVRRRRRWVGVLVVVVVIIAVAFRRMGWR